MSGHDYVAVTDAAAGTVVTINSAGERQIRKLADLFNEFTTPVSFRAHQTTLQSLLAATWTKINLQTEDYDSAASFDPSTATFTVPEDGIYQLSGAVHYTGAAAAGEVFASAVYVDGTEAARLGYVANGAIANVSTAGSVLLKLSKGQAVTLYGYSSAANDTVVGTALTYFSAVKVSR